MSHHPLQFWRMKPDPEKRTSDYNLAIFLVRSVVAESVWDAHLGEREASSDDVP